MTITGRCQCGAISYTAEGEPEHRSLCHCADCTRSAGAPVVGWALFTDAAVTIEGTPCDYESSPGTIRQFCGTCGTGLFYRNQTIFPGKVDVQFATIDDPEMLAPTARIQVVDAPRWWQRFAELPVFERFPG